MHITNVICNSAKLKASLLKSETSVSTLTTSLQHSYWNCRPQQSDKKKKRYPNWKEEVKLSLYASNMILCIEKPKDATSSWITALLWQRGLCNSMTRWAMPCRATQNGQVTVNSSDKTWSTGGGNGNAFWYFWTQIMASGAITSWQIEEEKVKAVNDFIFSGSKITTNLCLQSDVSAFFFNDKTR